MSDHQKLGGGALGGLFGKDSGASYEVYLNLTPLMDVMSNILFFLLAAFGATMVAILPTTVPVQSSSETSIEAEDDKVTVTVRAESNAITVSCESTTMSKDALKPYGARMQARMKEGDLKQLGVELRDLTAALRKIKEKFPGSKSMILVPDDDLRYEAIVAVMDAAREIKQPDGRRLTLFPEVVLSSIYTGD